MLRKSERRENTITVFIEGKNPYISGPRQFKLVLFEGQLYIFLCSVMLLLRLLFIDAMKSLKGGNK